MSKWSKAPPRPRRPKSSANGVVTLFSFKATISAKDFKEILESIKPHPKGRKA